MGTGGKLPKFMEDYPEGFTEEEVVERLRGQGWRPRQKVRMNPWHLVRLMDVPDGTTVMHVGVEVDPNTITVVLESDEWELVDPAVEAPLLDYWWRQEIMTDEQGRTWARIKGLPKEDDES